MIIFFFYMKTEQKENNKNIYVFSFLDKNFKIKTKEITGK
jgi:hypothetical protein